jgi:hypothetical protein
MIWFYTYPRLHYSLITFNLCTCNWFIGRLRQTTELWSKLKSTSNASWYKSNCNIRSSYNSWVFCTIWTTIYEPVLALITSGSIIITIIGTTWLPRLRWAGSSCDSFLCHTTTSSLPILFTPHHQLNGEQQRGNTNLICSGTIRVNLIWTSILCCLCSIRCLGGSSSFTASRVYFLASSAIIRSLGNCMEFNALEICAGEPSRDFPRDVWFPPPPTTFARVGGEIRGLLHE